MSNESSKTGGESTAVPLSSTAQGGIAPRRTRKPRAVSTNAFDDFVKAVRPELSEALGGDAEAANVIDDPAFGVVFRTWYDLRRTVSNAARKCRESLVSILACQKVADRMADAKERRGAARSQAAQDGDQ